MGLHHPQLYTCSMQHVACSRLPYTVLSGWDCQGRQGNLHTDKQGVLTPAASAHQWRGGCTQSGPSPSLYSQANRLSLSHKTIWINPRERWQTWTNMLEKARSWASPAQTDRKASMSPSATKLKRKRHSKSYRVYEGARKWTRSHRESNLSNFRHLLNTVCTHLSLAALEIAEHSSFWWRYFKRWYPVFCYSAICSTLRTRPHDKL